MKAITIAALALLCACAAPYPTEIPPCPEQSQTADPNASSLYCMKYPNE
jgi:putative hemolysin